MPYVPQTTWLSLITTGTKHVVGTKGWLCLEVGRATRALTGSHQICSKQLMTPARAGLLALDSERLDRPGVDAQVWR